MATSQAFGTLGVKFQRNPGTFNTSSCDCEDGKKCGNYHFKHNGAWNTITMYGQCANKSCRPRDTVLFYSNEGCKVARKQIDLQDVKTLNGNLARCPMVCGHLTVGVEQIDVILEKKGFMFFEIKSQCYSCHMKDAFICLKNENNKTLGQKVASQPCCKAPKIRLTSIKAQHCEPNGTIKVHSKHLRFSQNGCGSRFSRGVAKGKHIDMTVDALQQEFVEIDKIERLRGAIEGHSLYVDGNRRLVAYQKSRQTHVPVKLNFGSPRSVFSHPFTTKNGGRSIDIRGGEHHEYYDHFSTNI